MFRGSVLAAVLLAGCGSKTATEPRILEVFKNTPSIKGKALASDDCIWKTAKVSIFNQKNQKIKLDYYKCPYDEETRFKVKNGNEIFVESDNEEELHILSVWKTAPYTNKEFIESLILEAARDKCMAIQDANNNWRIGLNEAGQSPGNGWVMYPSLNDSIPKYSDDTEICGPYSFNSSNDWIFGVKDGIGIAYLEIMNLLKFYDLNSITYENRG